MKSPAAAPSEACRSLAVYRLSEGCALGVNKRQGNSAGSVLLKPDALPIVRSEGIGVADADAGGCFGGQGYLQKQIPLPVCATERALKTSRQRRKKI
ncbi:MULTISPECIES: hypothetical protein [Deefgea]|uniref:Uncharacterized protein n=1 Tax=Deefgea chitinilytica TaxID=570276 RepID=A0ABS2C837_9NEIS|nr:MULTISPECIES: hypothetical protein [Deefgea]MBM5570311.1 hypothetical protein [Deefgea chitinilytica]MBM9887540.1 hypothetical protein [Deefgea sp. CFH1-16]